jgi:hypothetical protein
VNLVSRCQGRFQWRRERVQRAFAQGQLGRRRLARHGVVEQDDRGVGELERQEQEPDGDLGAGGYVG